jgi:hypothetical protein
MLVRVIEYDLGSLHDKGGVGRDLLGHGPRLGQQLVLVLAHLKEARYYWESGGREDEARGAYLVYEAELVGPLCVDIIRGEHLKQTN